MHCNDLTFELVSYRFPFWAVELALLLTLRGSSWRLRNTPNWWWVLLLYLLSYMAYSHTGQYIQVSCVARKCKLRHLTTEFDLHPKAYCCLISWATGYQLICLLSSRSHNLREKERAFPSEEHCLSYFKRFPVHTGKDSIRCRSAYVCECVCVCACVCASLQAGVPATRSHTGTSQDMATQAQPRQTDIPTQGTHWSYLFFFPHLW